MDKRLIEEGFHPRYVLLPMLLSIALVALGYSITEGRRAQALELSSMLRERQDIIPPAGRGPPTRRWKRRARSAASC